MTISASRNPMQLRSGDRVKVIGVGHRDYGKSGVIVSLDGITDDQHGKPRALISYNDGFLCVSLPNLERLKE